MGKRRDDRAKIEFGDFQTPATLAQAVCRRLLALGVAPRSLVEPTCGVGNLLLAATEAFRDLTFVAAMDVNNDYVHQTRARLNAQRGPSRSEIEQASFFDIDWQTQLNQLAEPVLVLGNPPWVTNSDLGYLHSHNIPEKTKVHGHTGMDALTGKSNFDISEWMLTRLLSCLAGRRSTLAMLCKTAVARKVLVTAWDARLPIERASLHRIDSAKHFDAAVDAGLLIIELGDRIADQTCSLFHDLEATAPDSTFGHRDGTLVANTILYDRHKHLLGSSNRKWRSGIKHDCASVMELSRAPDGLKNGNDEPVDIESLLLYPMLKSSDVARPGRPVPSRWMLVTQTHVGEDTAKIAGKAQKTWNYLNRHKERFDRRASSIYRGKPAFSVFGVGDYTFAAWKVAISGLYKKLDFKVIGPHHGKPVVLDDTCYFLACSSEDEARFLARLLSSSAAQEFFKAFVFWDAKRPITAEVLRRLDLRNLATDLGLKAEFDRLCASENTLEVEPTLSEVPPISRRRRTASAAKRVPS